MPKRIPVALGFQYAPSRHAAGAARQCQNLRPEKLPPNSKVPAALYRYEGIQEFIRVPNVSAIRGLKEWQGVLHIVAGSTLYTMDGLGNTTSRGTINGAGRVSMGVLEDYLTIATSPGGTLYIWNGSALATVSDPDLPAVGWIESFDQFNVYGRQDGYGWGISAINNPASYDPLDVASAESQPDKIVTGIRLGRELLVMGEKTVEPFYNAGGSFPFERSTDGIIDVGCAAKFSPARCDNTVYWLAIEQGGYSVRRLEGRTPRRVSTPEIDDVLDDYGLTFFSDGITDAYGFSWNYGGHSFYALTLPSAALTLIYDVSTDTWQTRTSGGFAGWRVTHAEQAFRSLLMGDSTGRLGFLRRDTHQEYGSAIDWLTVCAPVDFERRMLTHTRLELEIDSKPKSTVRTVSMAFSDDEGQTWSPEFVASTGTYLKAPNSCVWTGLGSAISRLYRFKGSGNTPIGLIRAFVDVEVGG